MNNDRIVKWKCPECGNYHKWVWSTYDIFSGEITMTCDNPECGIKSKMYMIVEKGGNATAFVSAFNGNADNSQVEEKLRRATDKVMNSQTEVDISTVLIEGDTATIMGIKYKRVEEPKPTTLYDIIIEWNDNEDNLTCEELVNRIKKWLPDYLVLGDDEYNAGWNDCLQHLKENLK
jgi:C4-type Zn-finger protein